MADEDRRDGKQKKGGGIKFNLSRSLPEYANLPVAQKRFLDKYLTDAEGQETLAVVLAGMNYPEFERTKSSDPSFRRCYVRVKKMYEELTAARLMKSLGTNATAMKTLLQMGIIQLPDKLFDETEANANVKFLTGDEIRKLGQQVIKGVSLFQQEGKR